MEGEAEADKITDCLSHWLGEAPINILHTVNDTAQFCTMIADAHEQDTQREIEISKIYYQRGSLRSSTNCVMNSPLL